MSIALVKKLSASSEWSSVNDECLDDCQLSGSTKLAGRASFAGERAAGQLRSVDHAITASQQQSTSALAFSLQAFDLSFDQIANKGCTPLRPDQGIDTFAQTFRQANNGRLHS